MNVYDILYPPSTNYKGRKVVSDVEIEFYVMSPSETTYKNRLEKRDLLKKSSFQFYKDMALDLEFPNVAEGLDRAYEVLDNSVVQLRMDSTKPKLIDLAHKELFEEAERMRKEEGNKKNISTKITI